MHRVRPLPAYLLKRLDRWRATTFSENKEWFSHLAEHGQHPRAMFISCCDSRVDPIAMFEGEPGDFFLVRNVANLVPRYAPDEEMHGTSAAIEYAVTVLGVSHIVVMGHSGCGGVAACLDKCEGNAPALADPKSFIGRWMDVLLPGYERIKDKGKTREERIDLLEKEGVKVSIQNLLSFPFVAQAVEEKRLSLHGLWTDIGSGQMVGYDGQGQMFKDI